MDKTRRYTSLLLLLTYVLLIINYRFAISKYFYYLGYDQQYFSNGKLFIAFILTLVLIILHAFIKRDFYGIVYCIYLVLVYFGQSVFYVFNETNLILVVYLSIPLLILYVVQLFDRDKPNRDVKLKLSDKLTWFIFVVIAVSMLLPYLRNYQQINLNNLLLQDIYLTRREHSGQFSAVLGYLSSPISRVVLPFLFIYSLEYNKRGIAVLSVVSLLLMFLLTGAVKSILFGLAACIFFYKGNYRQKESRFLRTMIISNVCSVLEPLLRGSCIIADYMRRIFFVPANLFEVYYWHFIKQPTYFLHSRISKILGINEYSEWIPHVIGEQVLGRKGLSANVGIFVEGFLSFGTIGVIMASLVFAYIIKYLNRRQLSPAYFGILFTYIYVINTSFVETLFITHGLLFYLILARFIIPRRNRISSTNSIVVTLKD